LALQHGATRRDVPVEALRRIEPLHELAAQRGLADLPRVGDQHHLALQILREKVIEIKSHGDFFPVCGELVAFWLCCQLAAALEARQPGAAY